LIGRRRQSRPPASRLGCQEVVELVTDYLEGALTPQVRARLDEHLRACRHCAAYLGQMRTMVRATGRLAAPAPAPALDLRGREELVATYRRWTAA
jgi:anti-sigma factor RsiW